MSCNLPRMAEADYAPRTCADAGPPLLKVWAGLTVYVAAVDRSEFTRPRPRTRVVGGNFTQVFKFSSADLGGPDEGWEGGESPGALGNNAHVIGIAVETLRKTHDAVSSKREGKAMNKLIDAAGQVAKNANTDPERGRIIDIVA